MKDYISLKDAATECKCTRQNLMKLINKGTLPAKKKNNRWYVSKRDVLAHYADKIFGGSQEEYKKGETEEKIGNGKKQEYPSVLKVDIAIKIAKLEKLRMENDKEKNKLIDGAEASNTYFQAARDIRNALEALPARATPLVIGLTAHEIEQILKKEVNKVLLNLSEDILK